MTTRKRQTEANPLLKAEPASQYRCCVEGCPEHGVWSPLLHGSQWYCRFHAKLPEPKPRRQLSREETKALMKSIFGQSAEFEEDREAETERRAIEAEGDPVP